MKRLFALSIILSAKFVFGQSDSVSYYIRNLNWSSFDVFYSFAPKISIGDDAKKILHFDDSLKVAKLIKALSDKQKTVTAHLLLSQIFNSGDFNFNLGSQYRGQKSTGTVFKYNHLEWTKNFAGTYSIRKEDMQAIKAYWIRRRNEMLKK